MKKCLLACISICLLCLITACSSTDKDDKKELKQTQTNQKKDEDSKILIAYFTWSDNTMVEDPENVDVDASTSASVLQPGNVARMANWIQEEIGGDLFSIRVKDPYSSDYDECLDKAANEKAQNARPQLVENVDNIEEYDTVFIGYPNWWYSTPMAILSFIEQNNLSDKKIVLFCSHGTGGLADSVNTIKNALPASVDLEDNVIGIYRNDIKNAKPVIKEWIKDIGYERNK